MTTITRHSTAWYAALDAHVAAYTASAFAWGEHDCITFAAAWVHAVRGTDPLQGLVTWHTAAEALRALEAAGGLVAAVASRLGAPMPGAMAQAGDVVVVRHGQGRMSAGVCTGSAIAAPGEQGLLLVPITDAEAAWRV